MIYAPPPTPPAVIILVDNDSSNGGVDPGYSINGTLPGVQQYPPICGAAPLACALHYNPSTGAWTRQP